MNLPDEDYRYKIAAAAARERLPRWLRWVLERLGW